MDLAKLAVVETAILEVRHPVTEDVIEGMTILFHGPTSQVVRKLQLAKSQAAINRLAKGKKAVDLDAAKLIEENIADSFKRAVDWSGFELDGKKLDFTEENWVKVMTEYPWLNDQVSSFLGDSGNFLV